MSTTYIDDLKAKLRDIETRLRAAKNRVESGPIDTRAAALAELARLEERHKSVSSRLAAAEDKGAEAWGEVQKGIREEVDGLSDTFERWIVRFG